MGWNHVTRSGPVPEFTWHFRIPGFLDKKKLISALAICSGYLIGLFLGFFFWGGGGIWNLSFLQGLVAPVLVLGVSVSISLSFDVNLKTSIFLTLQDPIESPQHCLGYFQAMKWWVRTTKITGVFFYTWNQVWLDGMTLKGESGMPSWSDCLHGWWLCQTAFPMESCGIPVWMRTSSSHIYLFFFKGNSFFAGLWNPRLSRFWTLGLEGAKNPSSKW